MRALEILQARPGTTADQLAERLGVTERAARRYIGILREAGIQVESNRGPHGGYRLRPAGSHRRRRHGRCCARQGDPGATRERRPAGGRTARERQSRA
ncbi:HTH domain-containing protein [Lentzea sp. NPDC054927]